VGAAGRCVHNVQRRGCGQGRGAAGAGAESCGSGGAVLPGACGVKALEAMAGVDAAVGAWEGLLLRGWSGRPGGLSLGMRILRVSARACCI
jgi:hypothetical protein